MKTQRSLRFHIGIFGKRNSGKSSFLNSLVGQDVAIVSDIKGTTTDPIYKAMEIPDLGPVVFIDTAGIDDLGSLGQMRNEKSKKVVDKCDGFIYLLSQDDDLEFLKFLEKTGKPIIKVLSKSDKKDFSEVKDEFKDIDYVTYSSLNSEDREKIFEKIRSDFKENEELTITGDLVKEGSTVVLVMPQDTAAPKGRLITPQVQTIREILDKNARAICTKPEGAKETFDLLAGKIDLIITDSQVFKEIYDIKPDGVKLTSFSVLFSKFKGDIEYFMESVKRLDSPIENILIAEACSHPPVDEDIGTVKLPKLIKKLHPQVNFSFQRGDDFENIDDFDLIIACGSCMFNRSHVLSRVKKAKEKNIPMTNYGITIAYLKGILDKISI
ncbi:MAG: [FeFe] hydrogenase H-cluster maturation GTPase HydF [Anaerococcus sp.]|jgi:[FeFe] hydrogenase H-cluster maturation GTPase HydF|nr:[FeFe] hydrogenase H-cluster maturation GTPase HydF [Peptoniphilaceae bacterium]MDY3054681.1 [FeFe] hydrogenase H-cluster maturation GTPase HydF [Anaerococcus sp.]